MSKRVVDQLNGWLTVLDNPLTKEGVFPYLGSEIGAPDPNRIYYVYRPAEELQDPETLESFKLTPFIDEHEVLGKNATPAEKKGIHGVVGENVYFDHPYVRGNIRIHSTAAQAFVNSKQKIELSPGYRAKYDFTPGTFEGRAYDARQYQIRVNHLALVKEGRTGPDVSVQDHLITIDTAEFIMTLEEILAAIAAMSEEDKAKILASVTPETTDEETPAVTPEEPKPTAQEVVEAAQVIEEVTAEDELRKELKATQDQLAQITKQLATLDTGTLMRTISQRDTLAKSVSEYVGTFDHAGMTLDQVAEYGVEKLGIKCDKGFEKVALDAWMQGRKPERQQVTADSSSTGDTKAKLWGAK